MSNSKESDDDLWLTPPDAVEDDLELTPQKPSSESFATTSSIAPEKRKSEADALEELRLMQTNFVFLYGDS